MFLNGQQCGIYICNEYEYKEMPMIDISIYVYVYKVIHAQQWYIYI